MTDKLYDVMNWADVEEIVYSESDRPKDILGLKRCAEGLKAQVFLPTARRVFLYLDGQPEGYEMELADEEGFFALLLPMAPAWEKQLPGYHFGVYYQGEQELRLEDPYRFDSGFEAEDLARFAKGIHYEIYEKLGAHPCERAGVAGVSFAVWAPTALRVSVVGDFNLWDGRRHMMQRLGDSGIFELFIPGVEEGSLYKFELKNHHGDAFLKIDPYAFGFELRPANASVVRQLDYTWSDGLWMQSRSLNHDRAMSVYEVHLGSFERKRALLTESGEEVPGSEFYSYRELAPMLADYVLRQGFTHVELLPVMEHPLDASWGYQVTGYYAPTSRFGAPADFKYFVDYLHLRGIGVIIDWVPAHFPRDSWGMAQYDGSCLYEHADPRQGAHPHWGTLIYNYGRPQVSNFLLANALYWAREYHVDGIRVDAVASMLYLDYGKNDGEWVANQYGGKENLEAIEFFKHLNSICKKLCPGLMMIAEESTAWPKVSAPVEEGGLGFDYKWNMGWMNDFLSYMRCDPYFRKHNYGALTFSMMYQYSENFVLVFSHDEVVHGKGSMLGKMPGESFEEKAENLRAAYGFFMGHPGKKLMFMGQDFAQYSEWSEARGIEWPLLEYPVHAGVQAYVRELNRLYTTHPAMYALDERPEGFHWINCTYSEQSIVAFLRQTEKPEETLLVLANFDTMEHRDFRFGLPFDCEVKALLSSDEKKFGGKGLVRKVGRRAEALPWDEQPYSAAFRLAPMSTVIYQLMPKETSKPKESAEKSKSEKSVETPKSKKPVKKTTAETKRKAAAEKKAGIKAEKQTAARPKSGDKMTRRKKDE